MHANGRIGGARTPGNKAHTRPAGKFSVRLSHKGGTPLLAVDDELDLVGVAMKAVKHCQITFARHAKHLLDTLRDQALNQQVAGNSLGHGFAAPARIRLPTPNAATTPSIRVRAAPSNVAAYQPRSIIRPNSSGDRAKPTSSPEYTSP